MAINTLERLTGVLGPTVISVVTAPGGLDVEVRDVVIHDPLDLFEVKEGDLVLVVGQAAGPSLQKLISDLATRRVAGIVLKGSGAEDKDTVQIAERMGVAVLMVPSGASWVQIVQLIQSVVTRVATTAEDGSGLAAADLFSLADAIAEVVDAPVTIEDRLSRVLAYSGRQDEADSGRAETIIGRRVPERYVRKFEDEGVFRSLQSGRGCVYIDNIGEDLLPRLAVGVRAGDELLGSIWAAVPTRPSTEVERAFADTAKLTALHLLRHRAEADVERNLQAEMLASILQGTSGAREALLRLGLSAPGFRVMAAWRSADDETEEARGRAQLRDLFAVHLSTFRVRGVTALLGGIVYALIAEEDGVARSGEPALRIAKDLVERSAHFGTPSVGIGGHASGPEEIPRSKREAEEALRVLRVQSDRKVATIEEVRLPALLARFSDAAAGEKEIYQAKLQPLVDSDRSGKTSYIEALAAYFDEFGDYTAAAARLHISPNTLRYRLRKAQELCGIRLDDAEERLMLMLLVRLLRSPA
jgi:PucR C-terminal helix-turn-helix domain/GGDEF-like domain/Purine catabolism regulatory protein-like family